MLVNPRPQIELPKELSDLGISVVNYFQQQATFDLQLRDRTGGDEDSIAFAISKNPTGTSTDRALLAFDGDDDGTKVLELPVIADADGLMTYTQVNNNIGATNPPPVIEVNKASKLDGLATDNILTITQPTQSLINAETIQSTTRFVYDSSGDNDPRLEIKAKSPLFALEYIGDPSETYISGSGGDTIIDCPLVNRNVTKTTLLDVDNGVTRFDKITIINFNLGVQDSGDFECFSTRFVRYATGFVLNDTRQVTIQAPRTLNETDGATLFSFKSTLSDDRSVVITGVSGTIGSNSSLIRIDPAFRDSSRINVSGCTFTGGSLFDTSGVDGPFTAVADASIGTTNITEVQNVDGFARFIFTGVTVFEGQQVINTGLTTSNYNRTIQITETDGTSYYQSRSIFFTEGSESETGTFTSPSVEITSVGHGLAELTSVDLQTVLSKDYDGGSTIYNVQTDTFQVNRGYDPSGDDPQDGAWSTRGLNHKDVKVLASGNSGFTASKSIGCVLTTGNTQETIITGINDWVDVNLNGLAVESSNMERWRLVDLDNGALEIKSNEDYDNFIAGTFSITTPGTDRYELKYVKQDLGTGAFNDLPDGLVIRMATISASHTFPVNFPLTATKTDIIKPMVRNIDGGDNITITNMAAGPA